MKQTFITTRLGSIATYTKTANSNSTPIIFLHGVYFNHNLWNEQINAITDRTVIAIDMPLHGASKNQVPATWSLDDCADMLIEILDALKVSKVIAVGHSWGSMTILRAAHKNPERFAAVGLCNMPFEAATTMQKITFRFQHMALAFRNFYTGQAALALFGKETSKQNPDLLNQLKSAMNLLTSKEIKTTDEFVIIKATDSAQLINELKVPALAIKGVEDYVPAPPVLKTTLVKGGHVSPLETPAEVNVFINTLIAKVAE